MKTCAVVPIKTNNQRVPGKNTRLLHGKPLYYYAFSELSRCTLVDDVYINTSDPEILSCAEEWNFGTLVRPEELNSPSAQGNDLIKHSLTLLEDFYDIFVLHHVTNPFITSKTIDSCVNLLSHCRESSVIPMVEIRDRLWFQGKEISHKYNELIGTQFMEPVYREAGLYIFRISSFLEEESRVTRSRVFFPISAEEAFDIDTELDFRIAESLYEYLSSVS
jgi:CMP-N-acetylneuraminic acid synthetase